MISACGGGILDPRRCSSSPFGARSRREAASHDRDIRVEVRRLRRSMGEIPEWLPLEQRKLGFEAGRQVVEFRVDREIARGVSRAALPLAGDAPRPAHAGWLSRRTCACGRRGSQMHRPRPGWRRLQATRPLDMKAGGGFRGRIHVDDAACLLAELVGGRGKARCDRREHVSDRDRLAPMTPAGHRVRRGPSGSADCPAARRSGDADSRSELPTSASAR